MRADQRSERSERTKLGEAGQPVVRLFRFLATQRMLATLALAALVGFAISVYLTTVHYARVPLVCSTSGPVNCALVTSSAYSVIPFTQVPITIPGMLWFLASGGLAVYALRCAWLGRAEPPQLRLAHLALAAVGLLFVLYLVYAEIVLLRKICEWCTVVHLLTLLTFILTVLRLQESPRGAGGTFRPAPAPRSQVTHGSAGARSAYQRPASRRAAAKARARRR